MQLLLVSPLVAATAASGKLPLQLVSCGPRIESQGLGLVYQVVGLAACLLVSKVHCACHLDARLAGLFDPRLRLRKLVVRLRQA